MSGTPGGGSRFSIRTVSRSLAKLLIQSAASHETGVQPLEPAHRRIALGALALLASVVAAGCTTPASNNEPPLAVFELAKGVVEVNELVVLNGSQSHDPEGKFLLYQWSFGDQVTSEGPVVTHRYGAPGAYNITLTVSDEQGALNSKVAVLTVNAAPVAILDVSSGPYFAKEPISFSAAASRDPDGRIESYVWDLGDGESATSASFAHAYQETGAYNIRLEVLDNRGARANATASLFVDLHTYDVTFSAETAQQAPVRNFTLANQTKTITLEIFTFNITQVLLTLTWRDPLPLQGPPNDVIQLKVISPDGPSQTAVGTFDNITMEFNLNAIPSPVQVRAATPGDVPGVLGDAYLGSKGIGVWVVEITALELGGGLVQDQGFVPEPLFAWTLTTSVTAYSAQPRQIA